MNQISYNNNSSFPSQVVPDAEKATLEYGLAVGRAPGCTSPICTNDWAGEYVLACKSKHGSMQMVGQQEIEKEIQVHVCGVY